MNTRALRNVGSPPQTESNHDTALTLACAGGHEELVSVLIARGANIEHRDKKGIKRQLSNELVHIVKNMYIFCFLYFVF